MKLKAFRLTAPLAAGALAATLGMQAALAAGTGPQSRPGWPLPVNDATTYGKVLIDRIEYAWGDEEDVLEYDIQAWYGGDYQRLWIETEGEDVRSGGEGGEVENFDVQYSRLIRPFWDVQAGLGFRRTYGSGPDHEQGYLVLGIQGLAPYLFEVDANVRVSEKGDAWFDLEAEHDMRLTQRMYLQPRFEAVVAAGSDEDFGMGTGLNSLRLGLRLRYEFRREFAPYVGVRWWRLYGETADMARADGEPTDDLAVVAGIRAWF